MSGGRVIVGEAIWNSKKIASLEPPSIRAEYSWLYSLAGSNGVFEIDIRAIWVKNLMPSAGKTKPLRTSSRSCPHLSRSAYFSLGMTVSGIGAIGRAAKSLGDCRGWPGGNATRRRES